MGDRYQPGQHYGNGRPRNDQRDRDGRGRDYYDREPHHYDSRPRGGDYTFRGAADRQAQHYRPQNDFTFQAPGPSAPRFPPVDNYPTHQPQQSRSRRPDERRLQDRRPPPRQRADGTQGHRGRGGFRGRPAHKRDILRDSGRETTPEQLEGMNIDGQTRFRDVYSISDDSGDDGVIDLTRDSESDSEAPRKRTRVAAPTETALPKWSNPDPYTVLPPPETLGAPKKDIVQVIRKAKVDAAAREDAQTAVKENADFISLNFDDDFGSADLSYDSDVLADRQPPLNAPKAPSGFSHREELHGKRLPTQPTPQAQALSFTPINQETPRLPSDSVAGGPPSPPPGFVMPTDEELMAQYAGEGKGKKRKFGDIKPKTNHDIVDAWEPNHTDPTPWSKVDHSRTSNIGVRLHKEICDFFDFVRPYDYEEAVRRDLIKRVEHTTRQSGISGARDVQIHCFGSFAAGLYLPTADMDLVAVSPGYLARGTKSFCLTSSPMYKLSKYLQYADVAPPGGVAVIAKARVPIIKFADKASGIKVDVSFENDSGLLANKTFQTWKAKYPAMPVIVVLIKQLLAMRDLNEVFSGGLGGFSIICLVVSMMQLMPELQTGNMDPQLHYGDLLLNFLDLYGNKFDFRATGITFNPPGYFDKIHNPQPKQNAERLTIIDPNNSLNDISGGSHRIEAVLDCFRRAHAQLQRRLAQIHHGQDVDGSILGCFWGGNYTSFIHQREKLSLLHRGYAVSPPPPPAPQPAPKPKKKKQAQKKAVKQTQPFVRAEGADGPRPMHPLPSRPVAPTQQLPVQNGYADPYYDSRAYRPY